MNLGSVVNFVKTPLGEEVAEGTIGGLLYGSGALGTEQPWDETIVKTAGAIAGGIGLGMGGRRIGAWAGKRLHKDPLKNQDGLVAMLSRGAGNETITGGIKDQLSYGKGMLEESLIKDTSEQLIREAVSNPAGFAAKYDIDPQMFVERVGAVRTGRMGKMVVEGWGSLGKEQQAQVIDAGLRDYKKVEDLLVQKSAQNITNGVEGLADAMSSKKVQEIAAEHGLDASELQSAIREIASGKGSVVTGEQVGRAIGRFAGDEIGILGGSLLAGGLYDGLTGGENG